MILLHSSDTVVNEDFVHFLLSGVLDKQDMV
jgi:hypothetical protein